MSEHPNLKALREKASNEYIDKCHSALSDFCKIAWNRDAKGIHVFTIPADKERDLDCLISAALGAALGAAEHIPTLLDIIAVQREALESSKCDDMSWLTSPEYAALAKADELAEKLNADS